MKVSKFTLLTLLFISIACGKLTAQNVADRILILPEKKNTLSIISYLPTLFDGNGVFDRYQWEGQNYTFAQRLGFGIGIEYQRKISGKNGFLLSGSAFERRYAQKDDRCHEGLGIVRNRKMRNLSAYYLRNILTKKRLKFDLLAGLLYRSGNEVVSSRCIKDRISFSTTYQYSHHDLGLSTGARLRYSISQHIEFNSDLRFTEFVYRHDQTRLESFENFAGKGPTRHLLTFQIGLGYKF